MTTLNNRPNTKGLTGTDLLSRVAELGDINKTDLCLACGYSLGQDEEGNTLANFTGFYEALLEAKGQQIELANQQEGTEVNQEPLLNGLSISSFTDAIVEHIGETRKLMPYDMPVVDKLCALTQMAALLTHHQRMVQDLEQEGAETRAWMDDIEKLDMCIRTLVSIDLGNNDHWYKPNDQAPKVESESKDEIEELKDRFMAMKLILTDPDRLADYVNKFFGPEGPYPTETAEEKAKAETTVGLQVFTDVVKKANSLQAEVDQLKRQLGECRAKKQGFMSWFFPAMS